MNTDNPRTIPPDLRHYNENRSKFPLEELTKYAGQWVAWSPDGTCILAHHPEVDSAIEQLKAKGISYQEVVWSNLPPLDEDSQL